MAKNNKTADETVTEEKVIVRLPRNGVNDDAEFVGVNGSTYLIPKGKPVEIPKAVAEVLRHKEEMEEVAYAYDAEMQRMGEQVSRL